jgi:DNA-binding GntR family transcriptional regulator
MVCYDTVEFANRLFGMTPAMTNAALIAPPPATSAVEAPQLALKQQAYQELKRLILSDELAAGTVQSVRQLATRLGMSKTPVHSAIERLEMDGLVALAPQQGVIVRELSVGDIVNHYEIRQALEPFVMRRLAGRLTAQQVELLEANLSDHQKLSRDGRAAELIQVDAEFHQLLCSFLGNDEIIQVMQRLRDKVQRVIYRVKQQFPERITESYDEHRAIFDALVAGDGERAATLAEEHLDRGLRRFLPNR